MWIKICGLTTPDAVEAALDAGVDAIGFVFAKSVRQVTPEMAARLASSARGRVRRVAVTRHPTQSDIDAILTGFDPDVLQTDAADLRLLELPAALERLPVMRDADVGSGDPLGADADRSTAVGAIAGFAAATHNLPRRLLFEGVSSGAGVPCDWTAASRVARQTELVLAGGLTPDNVAAAVATVRPFGVDVSSGVEAQPGVKSPARIADFVKAVRSLSNR